MMRVKNGFILVMLTMLIGFIAGSAESKVSLAAEVSNSGIITIKEDISNNSKEVSKGSYSLRYYGSVYDVTTVEEYKSALEEAIANCADGVTINYQGTTSVGTLLTFASNAVKEVIQYPGNDYEKILLSNWSISCTSTQPQFTAVYTFTYWENADQRAAVDSKVDEILASIITPDMTEEQKEKAINDYILLNVSYDTSLKAHSAYEALFNNHKTVCQGYALLAYKMLTKVGFEARIITGYAGVAHAWNLVKVGGYWYHLDCTWNDPIPDVTGRVLYNYFNVTDNQLSSRTWDKSKYPAATVAYIPTDESIKAGYANYYSDAPTNITITNNYKISDTVVVGGLTTGDVVKVYSANTGETILGKATVASGKTDVTVTITQLGKTEGKVYVSVKNANRMESNRTEVTFNAEPITNAPVAEVVTVTNNYKIADTVKVTGLTAGNIVKVYKDTTTTTALGTATVTSGMSQATVKVTQIGEAGGNIYVTITESGKNESTRTAVAFSEESTTEVISADNIAVTNNITGKSDIVKVIGLTAGDVVKVYSLETAGTQLGTATVSIGRTEANVTISQVGVQAGSVYVTVANAGKKESARVGKAFEAEPQTTALDASVITVTNNYKIADTVTVTGLTAGNIVKVFKDATTVTALGSATVATGKTEVTVKITQMGAEAGKAYVALTVTGNNPSTRTEVSYEEEKTTDTPSADNITVTNNITGKSDTVKVTGLNPGDVIKVYSLETAGTQLGTATVAAGKTEAIATVSQVGVQAGSVYVTVANVGMKESARIGKAFDAEPQTAPLDASAITVTNNYKIADTVKVTGLVAGNIVRVYKDATTLTPLGSATVGTGKTEVTVNIAQMGSTAGKVYVALTVTGNNPSTRIEVSFEEEKTTGALSADSLTVTNNITGKADTVKVTGLTAGDVVKVYGLETGGTQLGTATVPAGKTEVIVTISQIGAHAGNIYATVANVGKKESARVGKAFDAEPQSTSLSTDVITVTNNLTGTADTITVTGLSAGSIVKVYKDATTITTLGKATVATATTEVTIKISQVGALGGQLYITVTEVGKNESTRTEVSFASE